MRVRNAHPGALAHLAPGDVGELDEKNAAVAAWLSAGMLVEEKPAEVESPAKKAAK